MSQDVVEGRVVWGRGRDLLVEVRGSLFRAAPAGRLRATHGIPVAGDVVSLRAAPGGLWLVVGIRPRTSVFGRVGPEGRYVPVVSNVDLLVVVMSTAMPPPSLPMLDRFLVLGEMGGLRCAICMNKRDLAPPPPQLDVYPAIGYPVVVTSVVTGEGIPALRSLVAGRISALVGPSGTGKSSLVNILVGGEAQAVREVSEKSGRGRHTTSAARLLPLESGGYLADTPGVGWLGVPPTDPATLVNLFPDLRPWAEGCRFGDCSHLVEPGCAVREAVERGDVARHRYESYSLLARGGT